MTACPTVFPWRFNFLCLGRKLKRKVIFNSCLNLYFFKTFSFWLFLFHNCPLAGNTRCLRFFLLFNSATSVVIAYKWTSSRKLKTIPGFHFYITKINSKHQLSFLFNLKAELMLLLAILNRLKSFRWYFLMFANNWIYWEVDLLLHVNMNRNNQCYWYVQSFHLTIYWQVFVLYFNPTIFHNL